MGMDISHEKKIVIQTNGTYIRINEQIKCAKGGWDQLRIDHKRQQRNRIIPNTSVGQHSIRAVSPFKKI